MRQNCCGKPLYTHYQPSALAGEVQTIARPCHDCPDQPIAQMTLRQLVEALREEFKNGH